MVDTILVNPIVAYIKQKIPAYGIALNAVRNDIDNAFVVTWIVWETLANADAFY